MNTSELEITEIETLLANAGLDFTVVDRCPHPACDICVDQEVSAAA